MLVDSHCHLDRLDYEKKHHDLADVLNKAQQRGVSHFQLVVEPEKKAAQDDQRMVIPEYQRPAAV